MNKTTAALLAAVSACALDAPARAATLTCTDVLGAGIVQTLAQAAASDVAPNDNTGRMIFVATNTTTNVRTLSIAPASASLVVPGEGTLTVPTLGGTVVNQTKMFGPFSTRYNDTNGRITATWDNTTTISVGCFRVPQP